MKLMTKEIEAKLKKYPIYSQDGKGQDAEVVIKYFNPCGQGTWLITEGEQRDNGDWELYGYCHLFEWEWGSIMLSELQNVNLPFGLTIERDLHCEGRKVKDLIY